MKKKKQTENIIVGAKPLEYLSTGFWTIDKMLGGGWAKGKIYELWCPPGAGKTTFMVQSASSIKDNTLFVDAERGLDTERIKQLGGTKKMAYVRPDNGEAGYEYIEEEVGMGKVVLVVVDSIVMMTPAKALDMDITDENYALEARLTSKVIKRLLPILDKNNTTLVLINQVRANMDAGPYGSKYDTPCGYVLEHSAHARIELRHTETIREKDDNIIGSRVKFLTKKCRSTAPYVETILPLYFSTGFDKRYDKLQELIAKGEIQKAGAWFYWGELKCQGEEEILEAICQKNKK